MKSIIFKVSILICIILEVIYCAQPVPYFAAINKMFAKKKAKHVNIALKKKSTQGNDKGIALTDLKEHSIICDHGLLSQFKLEKMTPIKYRYNYHCLVPKKCDKECAKKIQAFDKKRCKTINTNFIKIDEKMKQNTELLAKLAVECPKNYVLQGFKARSSKDSPPHFYYQFTCCPGRLNACGVKETPQLKFTTQEKNIPSLDRFDISVPDKNTQAITAFKMIIVPKGPNKEKDLYMKFKINYCSIMG